MDNKTEHIDSPDSSIEVTNTPHHVPEFEQTETKEAGLVAKKLIEEQYFTVYHWDLAGETNQTRHADFVQISVTEGEAEITTNDKTFTIKKGDHFVIPATIGQYRLAGQAEFIVSHP